jgi:presenilin-like A22 family membrane protease
MDRRTRVGAAVVATVCIFLAVQLGALALAPQFQGQGGQATGTPEDPTNSIGYVLVILLATGGMLVLIRFGAEQVIRGVVLLTSGFLSWYVLWTLGAKLLGGVVAPGTLSWLALGGGLAVLVGLLVHPEWYVIDGAGVLMGAGAAGLFGINFGLLPALVLLVLLAVYDAISVYGTEHMLTLAEGVVDLRIPVLLIVPTRLSFTMDDIGQGGAEHDDPLQREALFVGLGDAVIPAVLVASSGFFLQREAEPLVSGIVLNVPALGAMIGSIVGLLGLLYLVLEGRPHAGLPLLNGGAIAGYLVAALSMGIPLATALGL